MHTDPRRPAPWASNSLFTQQRFSQSLYHWQEVKLPRVLMTYKAKGVHVTEPGCWGRDQGKLWAWVKGLTWWKRSLEKEKSRQNVWHSSVRRGNNLNSAEQFAQMNLSLCYLLSCDTKHLHHLSQLPLREAVQLWGHNEMTQILGSWDQERTYVPIHGCPHRGSTKGMATPALAVTAIPHLLTSSCMLPLALPMW